MPFTGTITHELSGCTNRTRGGLWARLTVDCVASGAGQIGSRSGDGPNHQMPPAPCPMPHALSSASHLSEVTGGISDLAHTEAGETQRAMHSRTQRWRARSDIPGRAAPLPHQHATFLRPLVQRGAFQ